MRKILGVLLAAGLLVVCAAPARAGEGKNAFRYQVSYFTASGDFSTAGDAYKAKYQAAVGTGLAYEHKFSDAFALDVGLSIYKPDVKFTSPQGYIEKKVNVLPLTVGAMFRLLKSETLEFYAGPELAYIDYGTIEFSPAPEDQVNLESELTWGVKLGVDVPFNETWAFMATLEYIDAKSKTDFAPPNQNSNFDISPKPIIVALGAVYRF